MGSELAFVRIHDHNCIIDAKTNKYFIDFYILNNKFNNIYKNDRLTQ